MILNVIPYLPFCSLTMTHHGEIIKLQLEKRFLNHVSFLMYLDLCFHIILLWLAHYLSASVFAYITNMTIKRQFIVKLGP